MATRQVKFIGYTTNTVDIVFIFNGNNVFSGTVTPSGSTSSPSELFEFDIDQTVDGSIDGSISVSGGDMTFVTLATSHNTKDTPSDTWWIDSGSNNSKTNVLINDVSYTKTGSDDESLSGAWHVNIMDGDTMVCGFPILASPT